MADIVLHVTDLSGIDVVTDISGIDVVTDISSIDLKIYSASAPEPVSAPAPAPLLKAAGVFRKPLTDADVVKWHSDRETTEEKQKAATGVTDSISETPLPPVRRWSFSAPRNTALMHMEPKSPDAVTLKLNKLSYKTVDTMIREIYTDAESTQSTALDILAAYLKGQKILYTEAKTVCEQRLYRLMLPAILVTALCSVLSLQLKDTDYGPLIVSSLNGFNSFLLALISFLKLDAKAEAHKTSAYKYDKLQAFCEFKSGSILFVDDSGNNVASIIKEIESNVKDIKETNQFLLPEKIRYSYPKLFSTNIFSHVKSIQIEEMILINKLKGVINSLITLNSSLAEDSVILEKEQEQNKLLDNIIAIRNKYLEIDSTFNKEINDQIAESKKRWSCLSWTKS